MKIANVFRFQTNESDFILIELTSMTKFMSQQSPSIDSVLMLNKPMKDSIPRDYCSAYHSLS